MIRRREGGRNRSFDPFVFLYRKGFKKLKNPRRLVRGSTIGAMAGITAILVHSISDFNLYIPANAILFTILGAVVISPLPLDNYSNAK
jgi:hypothetical protein